MLLLLSLHQVFVLVVVHFLGPFLVGLGHFLPHDLREHTVAAHWHEQLLGFGCLILDLLLHLLQLSHIRSLQPPNRVWLPMHLIQLRLFVTLSAKQRPISLEDADLIVDFHALVKHGRVPILAIGRKLHSHRAMRLRLPDLVPRLQVPEVYFPGQVAEPPNQCRLRERTQPHCISVPFPKLKQRVAVFVVERSHSRLHAGDDYELLARLNPGYVMDHAVEHRDEDSSFTSDQLHVLAHMFAVIALARGIHEILGPYQHCKAGGGGSYCDFLGLAALHCETRFVRVRQHVEEVDVAADVLFLRKTFTVLPSNEEVVGLTAFLQTRVERNEIEAIETEFLIGQLGVLFGEQLGCGVDSDLGFFEIAPFEDFDLRLGH